MNVGSEELTHFGSKISDMKISKKLQCCALPIAAGALDHRVDICPHSGAVFIAKHSKSNSPNQAVQEFA